MGWERKEGGCHRSSQEHVLGYWVYWAWASGAGVLRGADGVVKGVGFRRVSAWIYHKLVAPVTDDM